MQEKRKSDGKSQGIILKGISKVILASVRIQEEKSDKAEGIEGKKENYSKEGKVPEGFGLGLRRMRKIRTASAGNYSCVNKRDRVYQENEIEREFIVRQADFKRECRLYIEDTNLSGGRKRYLFKNMKKRNCIS